MIYGLSYFDYLILKRTDIKHTFFKTKLQD